MEPTVAHFPRLFVHDDGVYVSVGFNDTPDTLLKVGGGLSGAVPPWRDVERVREWAAAVNVLLERASSEM